MGDHPFSLTANEVNGGPLPPRDGRITGRGATAARQGMQTVRAYSDKKSLGQHKCNTHKATVYPIASADESYDIMDGEILVRLKNPRNGFVEDRSSLHVLSSLNGYNSEAVDAFPKDPKMQKLAARNGLQLVGVAFGDAPLRSADKGAIAVQFAGVSTHEAVNDMPIGCYAEVIMPSISDDDTLIHSHVRSEKALLELKPWDSSTFEGRMRTILTNYAEDPTRFKR